MTSQRKLNDKILLQDRCWRCKYWNGSVNYTIKNIKRDLEDFPGKSLLKLTLDPENWEDTASCGRIGLSLEITIFDDGGLDEIGTSPGFGCVLFENREV